MKQSEEQEWLRADYAKAVHHHVGDTGSGYKAAEDETRAQQKHKTSRLNHPKRFKTRVVRSLPAKVIINNIHNTI
ncbi:hypothetical protein EYF80_012890 [Liparis tanakae]|uniref:Uncharacterized protein n=1 Tax=Liparis tanakae TaxID=230148 RepID=A0A4Z2IGC6_9TELE|nr:hypothetical protein EYF80_012890 [Liparis tanakae]